MRRFSNPVSIRRRRNTNDEGDNLKVTRTREQRRRQQRIVKQTPPSNQPAEEIEEEEEEEEVFESAPDFDQRERQQIEQGTRATAGSRRRRSTPSSGTASTGDRQKSTIKSRPAPPQIPANAPAPVNDDSIAALQASIQLSFQYKYFPERVPKRGDARGKLANYFPYVELRKRSIPLPSVNEYLRAIQKAPEYGKFAEQSVVNRLEQYQGEEDLQEMFDLGYSIFSNSVILLVRKNGNTQVIFPGKSTTSYKGRGARTKNYVWTNSVEFCTIEEYKNLPLGQVKVNADIDIEGTDKLGNIQEDDGRRILVGSFPKIGRGGSALEFKAPLDFANSLQVAESYLLNSWIPAKSAKARKKLEYKIFIFVDQSPQTETDRRNGEVDMTLGYAGFFDQRTRFSSPDRAREVSEVESMSSFGVDKLQKNPRRLTSRSHRVNNSGASSLRRRRRR